MSLPFWVEDRTGKGEKRLCGCCWLRENFMGRTEAGTVDLVRLSGTGKELPLGTLPRAFVSSGLQARLFLPSLSGSKALVRTCFWYRLWQFLTHTMNSGWMWRLCSWEGQAGPLHCTMDFTVYVSFSSHLRGSCCVWRGEWSHCGRGEHLRAAAASLGLSSPPCLLTSLSSPPAWSASPLLRCRLFRGPMWETADSFNDSSFYPCWGRGPGLSVYAL